MTKMTKDELIAVLRALERKGIIESGIIDGEVAWRLTAKGRAVRDGEAAQPADSRYGLDS
jgi:DNA-binding HxlR family transcriptional regulator